MMKRLTYPRVQTCVTQTNLILILSYKISIYFSLTLFLPMFPFDPPEKIRKPKVF